jgi:hypothetical protein
VVVVVAAAVLVVRLIPKSFRDSLSILIIERLWVEQKTRCRSEVLA